MGVVVSDRAKKQEIAVQKAANKLIQEREKGRKLKPKEQEAVRNAFRRSVTRYA